MKIRTYLVTIAISTFVLSGCNGQNRGAGGVTNSSSNNTNNTLPSATYSTTVQTMNATTTLKILSWNLATQIQGSSPVPGGGTFQIGVQEVNSIAGGPEYYFSNPTIVGGSSAILVQNIGLVLNGITLQSADVFTGVNRMVPASQTLHFAECDRRHSSNCFQRQRHADDHFRSTYSDGFQPAHLYATEIGDGSFRNT